MLAKQLRLKSLLASLGLITSWATWTLLWPGGQLHAVVTLAFLLLVPGYHLWRIIVGYDQGAWPSQILTYVVGLSLLFLMLCGLLLNESFVTLGHSHPLSLVPLTYSVSGATALLACMANLRRPAKQPLPVLVSAIRKLRQNFGVIAAGLLLPILAAGGAISLNNGGSAGLTLLSLGSAGGLFMIMVIKQRALSPAYGWLLYCICLSLLLATSLRGWNITGHDVMQEFQVFQLTATHAAWHMQYYQDAYNACLSLTILPTMLRQLTGIADPYIFKFVFQLLFALIAPVMYNTIRTYASKRIALLATFLFIAFPTFLTDMTMLNRQEMALLFLALSLQVGLDRTLKRTPKSLLSFLFLVGMVLSHYSTSYVALSALMLAIGLGLMWRLIDSLRWRRSGLLPHSTLTSVYHTPVVIAALLVLIAWGTFATQTSTNISQTAKGVSKSLSNIVHGHAPRTGSILQPVPASVADYEASALKKRLLPANDYYRPAVIAHYPLTATQETMTPPTAAAANINPAVQFNFYNLTRSAYAVLIEATVAAGIIFCFFSRRSQVLPRQYLLIGLSSLMLVGVQVVLPSAVINYGLTRLIQQSLLFLALPAILFSLWFLKIIRIPQRAREVMLATILVGFFAVLSGFLPALTGNYKPTLTVSNSGFYYAAYYTHQDEISGAQWIKTQTPKGSRVYSDEFMRRKLITYGNTFAQPTLAPSAIAIDSYVYLSHGNIQSQQVAAYDGPALIYYQPPLAFLQANKNLVYNSGNVQIYK